MTDHCPILSGDPAIGLVESAQDKFMDFAFKVADMAIDQARSTSVITIEPTSFNIDFSFAQDLAPFVRPVPPVLTIDDFTIHIPDPVPLPSDFDPQPPSLLTVADPGLTPPSLAFGVGPDLPNIVAPTVPDLGPPLEVPDEPDTPLPPVPTLEQLNLPPVPVIDLPLFEGVRPVFAEQIINENWSFEPEPYVSALQDALKAKVLEWLNGQRALPAAIERAIYDEGRARIEVETQVEVDTIVDDWASRGFMKPPGMMAAQVDAARQKGQDRKAEFNTATSINLAKEALENMRLALTQGVALEQVAVNIHIEEQRLLLAAAQFTRETTIALLNARISIFQAELAGYQADAQVLAARIQAELAKVEVYRAQIEGVKALGEVNDQRVRLYATQIAAVNALVALYVARVDGVKAKAEVQQGIVAVYKSEVEAFTSRWQAYAAQWDGYKSSVEAENIKAEVYGRFVEAFGVRVNAASTQNTSAIALERLRIDEHQQRLNRYFADLKDVETRIEGEKARIAAVSAREDAKVRIYAAEATVEEAASAATDRSFQLGLSEAEASANFQLEAARVRVQENIGLIAQAIELSKLLESTFTQLAASAMSAVHASTSLSSSRSNDVSCHTNWDFSGEISDG